MGMAIATQISTTSSRMTTATPVLKVHCQLLPAILAMAQTAVMGAFRSTCSPMTIRICTCMTSLVERVIRLAVENFPISAMVKDCTLLKRRERRLEEKLAAIRAAQMTVHTDAPKLMRAQPSIFPPAVRMSAIALPSVWTSVVISDI